MRVWERRRSLQRYVNRVSGPLEHLESRAAAVGRPRPFADSGAALLTYLWCGISPRLLPFTESTFHCFFLQERAFVVYEPFSHNTQPDGGQRVIQLTDGLNTQRFEKQEEQ